MIPLTQDQYGQARGPGYVVRGDVAADDETEELPTGQSRPMTRFQKVASALHVGGHDRDEQDQTAADQAAMDQAAGDRVTPAADPDAPAASPPWGTQQDEAVAAVRVPLSATARGSAARSRMAVTRSRAGPPWASRRPVRSSNSPR